MAHELVHGGGVVRVDEDHFSVGIDAVVDLEMGELGDVFGDGIGREPLALLVEDHHGHASDGFGHGKVAEDGVFGHGGVAGDVAQAVGAIVDDFSVAGEDGDDAGDLFLVDGLLHDGVEVLESLAGEADRLGLDDVEVEGVMRGGHWGGRLRLLGVGHVEA